MQPEPWFPQEGNGATVWRYPGDFDPRQLRNKEYEIKNKETETREAGMAPHVVHVVVS